LILYNISDLPGAPIALDTPAIEPLHSSSNLGEYFFGINNNNWYFIRKYMARNTSILLGQHFGDFISTKISSGQYSSASEVIRTALRLLETKKPKGKI